ncbi:MAG: hypothetical protein COA78_15430 [Blastopirellula sp.]|nr:MAG: hypothetical protein COA78_15430 [Blastopirellula sp.]
MELIKKFTNEQYLSALSSWDWLPLSGKSPFLANAFGDLFLEAKDGIYFLDKVDGTLEKISINKPELQKLLNTADGQERFLWLTVVKAVDSTGLIPGINEVYDFIINPVLGGEIDLPNINTTDFEVATNIAGQIHSQIKDLPEGTPINNITIDDLE